MIWYQRDIFLLPPTGIKKTRERFSILLIVLLLQPSLLFFFFSLKNFFVIDLFGLKNLQESWLSESSWKNSRPSLFTLGAYLGLPYFRGQKFENGEELFIISICFPFQHLNAMVNWLFWQRGSKVEWWRGNSLLCKINWLTYVTCRKFFIWQIILSITNTNGSVTLFQFEWSMCFTLLIWGSIRASWRKF